VPSKTEEDNDEASNQRTPGSEGSKITDSCAERKETSNSASSTPRTNTRKLKQQSFPTRHTAADKANRISDVGRSASLERRHFIKISHSGSGNTGRAKKGGGGGKYTWGKEGDDEPGPAALDEGDPNYDGSPYVH